MGKMMDGYLKRRRTRPKRRISFDGRVLDSLAIGEHYLTADPSFARSLTYFSLGLLLAFAISLCAHGTYISSNPIDYLFMVEQGWRLAQGQLPYRDFITPVGPVYYALIGTVEYLTSGDPAAYRLTGFLALLVIGPGLIWLSWRRLPGYIAIFISLFLAFLPISPREMDGMFFDFEFLAIYNSLCWPLIAVVMLGALFMPARPAGRSDIAGEGVVIGLAVVLLLGLKATHGLVGVGVLLIGLLIRPANRPALSVAVLVTLALCGLAYLLAPDMFTAYLANLAEIGRANNLAERLHMKLHLFVYQGTVTLLMSAVAIWLIDKYRQFHAPRIAYADIAAALTIFFATYADAINDNEDTPASIVLLFVLLWLVATRVTLPISEPVGRGYRQAKACLLALPFVLWAGLPLASDSLAIFFHTVNFWVRPATSWPTNLPSDKPQLSSLKILGTLMTRSSEALNSQSESSAYIAALQDGVTALQEAHLEHARIYEVRFNNVLAWLLQAPSPRGVLAWLDIDRTFSKASHPPADTYLQDVDVLMISKLSYDAPWAAWFLDIYGAVIDRQFDLLRETPYWRIYRHR